MYGFHKVKNRPTEFAHPLFLQGEEQLLAHIKRKSPKSKVLKEENEALKKEVELLRKQQDEENCTEKRFLFSKTFYTME
jgi:hypothetical protein